MVTALLLVLMAGMVVLGGASFQRFRLDHDSQKRTLTVQADRWPLRARKRSTLIDDVEGIEIVARQNQSGSVSYTANLLIKGALPFDLGVHALRQSTVASTIATVDARLASWRQP